MSKAIIVFSNNEELSINEDTLITVIHKMDREPNEHDQAGERNFKYTTTSGYPLEPYYHHHDGFIPSLTEIFSNCDFFSITGDTYTKIYSTSAIVSITNVD